MKKYEISEEHPNDNLHGEVVIILDTLGNCQGEKRVKIKFSDGTIGNTFKKFLEKTTH